MSDEDKCEAASLRVMDEKVRAMNRILTSRLDLEMKLIAQLFESEKLARQLNATEVLRRLDELNHAHVISLAKDQMFMRSDVYYASQKDFDNWKIGVVSQIAQAKGMAAAMGFVLLLIQVVIAIWKR